jgi:deoxyribonuclease-4
LKLGAHVKTSGGLDTAPQRAADIGAEAIQIFASVPQTWQKRKITDEQVDAFREGMAAHEIGPTFIHGIYLVNLAADRPDILPKSVDSLITDLTHAARIGSAGVIFHVGVFRTPTFDDILPRIAQSIGEILDATPPESRLIIENAAGERKGVGAQFWQIGALIRAVASPRVQVCLDTQHMFASGYDDTTPEGIEALVKEFETEVGIDRLVAVHCNDSKVPFGKGVDRHENIGEGHMGFDAFRHILAHPAFREIPFLLEVPGFENQGPDARNVELLRAAAEQAGVL